MSCDNQTVLQQGLVKFDCLDSYLVIFIFILISHQLLDLFLSFFVLFQLFLLVLISLLVTISVTLPPAFSV